MDRPEKIIIGFPLKLAKPQAAEYGVGTIYTDAAAMSIQAEAVALPIPENGIAAGMIVSASNNGHFDKDYPDPTREQYKYSLTESVLGETAILAAERIRSKRAAEMENVRHELRAISSRVGANGLPASDSDRELLETIVAKYDKAYSPNTEEAVARLRSALVHFSDKGFRASKVTQDNVIDGFVSFEKRRTELIKQGNSNRTRLINWRDHRRNEQKSLELLRQISVGRTALVGDHESFLYPARKITTKPGLLSLQNLGLHMEDPDFWPQVARLVDDFLPAYRAAITTSSMLAGESLGEVRTEAEYTSLAVTELADLEDQNEPMSTVNEHHQKLAAALLPYCFNMQAALLENVDIKSAQNNAKLYKKLLRDRTLDPKQVPPEWYTPLPFEPQAQARLRWNVDRMLNRRKKV